MRLLAQILSSDLKDSASKVLIADHAVIVKLCSLLPDCITQTFKRAIIFSQCITGWSNEMDKVDKLFILSSDA